MKIGLDEMAGYNYEIWFPYTQALMGSLRPGDLVAVPNFGTDSNTSRYSVLEVVRVLPMHYALGSDLEGYPGFLDEAAKSASQDWQAQPTNPTEDTTKIWCLAIPTDFELSFPLRSKPAVLSDIDIRTGAPMPMPGMDANLLPSDLVGKIYNKGLPAKATIELGTLTRDKTVKIRARLEELIKTHIGMFGYTGTGKSNLVSTIVSNILQGSEETIKVVIFDLMGEYVGLFLDELLSEETNRFSQLVVVGEESLPGPVIEYLKGNKAKRTAAENALLNHLLLPKGLKAEKERFIPAIRKLLTSDKIRFYLKLEGETIQDIFDKSAAANFINDRKRNQAERDALQAWCHKILGKYWKSSITQGLAKKLSDKLEACLDEVPERARESASGLIRDIKGAGEEGVIPSSLQTYLPIIKGELNNNKRNSLFVVTAAKSDSIREFSRMLCVYEYEERRITGSISPLVLFVFDEADEYIPQEPKGTYEKSSEAVETIARRGRKFGLGVCIATQRVAYLNTSIMAQPHTYFVSRLPRQTDRQRVTEAFGLSEEMLRETFRFGKGDWLVVSHDATGLQGVPIPTHAYNAEDRIRINLLSDTSHNRSK